MKMNMFALSVRNVAKTDLSTLNNESCKSLAYLCRDLIRQTDHLTVDPALKARVKSRLEQKLVAAWKRTRN